MPPRGSAQSHFLLGGKYSVDVIGHSAQALQNFYDHSTGHSVVEGLGHDSLAKKYSRLKECRTVAYPDLRLPLPSCSRRLCL